MMVHRHYSKAVPNMTMLIILINIFSLWILQSSAVTQTRILNDGNQVPIVALGTYGPIDEPDKIVDAVVTAIEAGYRHIDTAAYYLNEELIGKGIQTAIDRCIVTRKELFVTTKLDPRVNNSSGVLPSIKGSLRRLKLDYVDLYLIHTPYNLDKLGTYNDVVEIWKGMESVKRLDLTKSIGVSNFNSTQINQIMTYRDIVPAVNEIEINPSFTNLDLVAYCQSVNITVHAYGPLGYTIPRPVRPDVSSRPLPTLNDPYFVKLAKKYRVVPSQIVLRYLIDRDLVILPKSCNTRRIKQNIDLFKFSLTQQEVLQINNFNLDYKLYLFDHTSLSYLAKYAYGLDFAKSLEMIDTR